MPKAKTRNVNLDFYPQISNHAYKQRVFIRSGACRGQTIFRTVMELDPETASAMIFELRKSLRAIRDFQAKRLHGVVTAAERAIE